MTTVSAEPGDSVQVAYVGRFESGSVFATSDPEVAVEHDLDDAQGKDPAAFEPLTFTVGRGDVIEGLDDAVVGMAAGEAATVTVPPERAYGDHSAERVREYEREAFEAMVGEEPAVGLHVQAQNDLHGDVVAVTEDAVTVDFNHELAGKTLVFDLQVLAVE
jgi:FKBP-type peptidyl-prolyl cis-trans isomerase 2